MQLHVFGVRHHGPGCARSLRAALEELKPDAILLEAPADVEPVLPLSGHPEMQPPVAMLLYPRESPARSVIYPLAVFSPEWQALQWAHRNAVPVRAMDLPMFHRLALDERSSSEEEQLHASPENQTRPRWRSDPIAMLAEAAGYADHELWWEEQIERRRNATGLFEGILEAMRAVRDDAPETSPLDLQREAFMRKTIRAAIKSGFQKIAIVCGAWHAPVLDEIAVSGKLDGFRIRDDNARLKGLPRVKTLATWIPWTHGRLSYRSGYGAGVHAPGWYAHLWESEHEAPTRWIVNAARLLRENDLNASAANVIEARRLADALAALRELRAPGLKELNEAILSVLCHGEPEPLQLIRTRLEIGDRLGNVPAETPAVPLADDLKRLQKSLRLKPTPHPRQLDLDLRTDHARSQSRLLHRLRILGIPWGEPIETESNRSTFHELWELEWQPEFAVSIIEASPWGNTVESAASSKISKRAMEAVSLAEATSLLDVALHADLTQVMPTLLARIQSMSAVATDVMHLMEALLPLVRLIRYGDVRGSDLSQLRPILHGILERILVGLPATCSALSDELAERVLTGMQQTQEALQLYQSSDLLDEWFDRLRTLMQGNAHGLIRGWSTRSLLEQRHLDATELEQQMLQAFSPGVDVAQATAWITGFLRGSGLLLICQEIVWPVLDRWLTSLSETDFIETLPLLRRAFADFTEAERRQMGEQIRHLDHVASAPHITDKQQFNQERAQIVWPTLAEILGVRDSSH